MNAKPISEPTKPGCWAMGMVSLFGSLFLFAGLAVLVTQVAMPWWSVRAAAEWSQVPCKILSGEIEEHRGDETTYSVDIEYEYTVENQTYRSSQYDFSTMYRSHRECREIIANYPVGQNATCYVDLDDPNDAVLARTAIFTMWLVLGVIFSAAGAGVAIGIPLSMIKNSKSVQSVGVSGSEYDGNLGRTADEQNYLQSLYPDDLEDKKWDQPQRLKPSATKIGSLIGIVVLAMFWNGIVGLLVSAIFFDAANKILSIFLGLFILPFVLIGLVIILGVIKAFLVLFNPVVEIALSTGAVARGSEVDVAWEVKGNAGRIRRLQIAVVGTESAKYRQGTDIVTATSGFGLIPVADSTEAGSISFGSVAIKIPDGAMHTFTYDNNKITWAIQVKGEIRRWPDVLQTHVFRVKP